MLLTLLPRWLRTRAASFSALAVLALAFVPRAVHAQSGEPTGGGGGGGGLPHQTLSIYGTDAPSGTIDPNTDCSRDGQVTWLPAYALDRDHPWGNMAGTTRWISRVVDGQSAPGISTANPENLDFRIRFYAPADLSGAAMTFVINPDNFGDIYLNGTKLNAAQIVGPTNASFTVSAGIQPGLNTIIVRLIDTGGWLGINYKIDLSGNASTPFQRLIAPPVVSSVTSTLPNGAYKAGTVIPIQVNFNRAVTVTSGIPVLFLETGATDRQALYQSGSGTSTLNLTYTVQAGDSSFDLDYVSAGSFAGTIKAAAADLQAATLTLPAPGTINSLGANKALVIDTVAPVLTVPANLTVEAASAAGAAVSFAASATDNVALASLTYSKNPGTVFPVGATVVTVTATDTAGNVTTKTFTVTVRFLSLTEDKTTVTVAEGSTATNAGTFSEGSGAAVALTVSKGAIAQTGAGQWTFQQVLTPGGNPIELVLDTQENLYVVSQTEVVKYDPTGALLARWAVAGTPTGIAIDTAHNWLYVSLRDGNAVKKFALDGTLLLTITNGFNAPHCVATDASGNVYVTDAGNARVQVFDSNGTFLRQWGSSGTGNGQFSFPQGIRITPAGTVYVADRNNNRIQYFNTSGTYLGQWGSGGTGNGQFNSPAGVGIDPSGNVYVGDINNNRVQKFSATGTYLDQVGPGTGSGTLSMPHGTAFPPAGRSVYIASWNNGTVVKYLTPGAWSWTYAAPIGSVGSSTVTVTANDGTGSTTQTFTLVVTDGVAPRVASIQRQSPTTSPTNADTLTFRVWFNEAVSGVDATDFVVSGTTATASVATVLSSVYDVTLSGGNLAALNGTVTLSFAAGQNIKDTAGNALVTTAPFGTNDNSYALLNNLAPTDILLSSTSINQSTLSAGGAVVGTISTIDPDVGDTFTYRLSSSLDATDSLSFSISGSTLKLNLGANPGRPLHILIVTTDAGGLFITKPFTITVVDDVAPDTAIATKPAAISNSASATFTFTSTESGATFEASLDGAAFAAATTPLTLAALSDGSHTFQVRAKDAAGNLDATPASYTWLVDATGPVITVPTAPIVAEATGPDGAAVSFTVSATDARDGAVLATPSAASGSTFHLGDTTVTVTATDSAGNVATKSFTVTVRDTTAPAISVSLPAAPVLDEKFNGYTGGNPTGAQYLSGLQVQYGGNLPAWTKSGFVNAVHAVNLSGAGNWAVMFYAPDVITLTNGVAANTAGTPYSVSFLSGPAVYQDPGQATGANDGLVVEILRTDGSVLKSFSHKPGAYAGVSTLAPASYAYTGDGTGNVTVRIRTIDANSGRFGGVIDNLVIAASTTAGTVADLTFEATSPAGAVANYDAVAYDLVSGIVPVTSSAPSGGTFVIGATPVTLSAVDAAGNPATAHFNIIVKDTVKPTLTVPANLTVAATSAAGATVNFAATSTDAASTPVITYSQNPGTAFSLGLTTVNVVATDSSGNTQTGSFTVTVNPTVASIAFTTPAYTYDGTAKVATVTTAPAGLPVTLVYDGASATAPINAGTHAVTATVNETWITGSATSTVEIAKADPAIVVAPYNVVYDGNAHGATGLATGAGGVILAGLDLNATVHTDAGTFVDGWSFTDATGNYKNAAGSVSSAITKATPAITVTPYAVTFDGNGHAATGAVIGVKGEALAGLALGGTQHTNAGSFSDTWTFTDTTGNYANASGNVIDTIAKATATVAVTPYSVTYDAHTHLATGSVVGVKGETLAGLDLSGTMHTGAGAFTDTWTFTDATGNYANATGTVSDALARASATIAVSGYSGVYDGQPHGATGTALGVDGTDLSSLLNTGAKFTKVPGGTALWSFHDPAGNYADATGSATITLTKAPAILALGSLTQTYGGVIEDATIVTDPADLTVLWTYDNLPLAFKPAGGTLAAYAPAVGQTLYVSVTGASGGTTSGTGFGPYTIESDLNSAATLAGLVSVGQSAIVQVMISADGTTFTFASTLPTSGFTAGPVQSGTYAVTGTVVDWNYSGSVTGVLTIAQATVVVTAEAKSKIYGTVDPLLTYQVSGLLGADTANGVLTGALARGTGEAVGSYAIAQGTLAVNSNYTLRFTGSTLAITPATLVVTANPQAKIYGALDPALTFGVSGFQLGDTPATALSGALARTAGENVTGSPYAIAQGTLVANGNYVVSFTGSALAITPASLAVTAATVTKVYGSADPSLAFTITGGALVSGDAFTGGLARSAGENVGSYAIAQGTLSAGSNYTLGFTGATLAITPKPASVTVAAATKVYGAADPVFTGTLAGFLPTDNVAATYARTTGENVVGGPYSISAAVVANPALTNYDITSTAAPFTITPAPLAVVANAQSKVYGSADPALAYAVTGLKFTDTAATVLSGALTRIAGETVAGGPYVIQRGTLVANSNYTLGYTGANLTITPATATIAVNGYTGVYDGHAHAATGTATGVGSVNLASMLNLGASFTNVPGGAATWTFHDAAGNYSDASGSVAITLTKAATTIAVTPYTVIYDGNAHTATGTVKGVSGETLAGLVLTGTTHTNAGTFTDTWTFTDATGNYNAANGTVTDTITKAAATIAVTPYGVVYDTHAHTATGTVKGVKGETLAGLVLTGTTHTNAGAYTDPWTFADATGNYAAANGSIIDAITKAPATVTLSALSQMYDGQPNPVTATTSPAGLTVVFTYGSSSTAPTLPGSYTVTATINDPNYTGTASATLTVGVTALIRHGLTLDGDVDGSVQVMTAENSTFNGSAGITGDLLVPGLPTVRLNGNPTFGGTQDGIGAATPTNYTITLNGGALLRKLIRRTDPLAMPTVAAPANPTGTRSVNLNKSSDPIGAWSTLKELTLNGNVGNITVPAGVYASLTANGGSAFTFGVAGATTPSVYELQSLTINGNAALNIVGPVILIVKNGINFNGNVGAIGHAEWLDLRVNNGSVTLNGNVTFNGNVTAPAGTVTINGNSTLTGNVAADKLVVNGNGVLIQSGH